MYKENNIIYQDESKMILEKCLDSSISSVKIDKKVKHILKDAFKDCYLLKNITIPKGVIIESFAFDTKNLENLTIDNSCYIKDYAFDASNLKTIAFKNDVNPNIFYKRDEFLAPNLERIVVISLNEVIPPRKDRTSYGDGVNFTIDGVWYELDSDGKYNMLYYPPGKKDTSFTVPDFVDYIYPDTFYNNKFISEITIKNIDLLIGERAFSSCKNLSILFLEKLPDDDVFFDNCKNLEKIVTKNKTATKIKNIDILSTNEYKIESAKSFKEINNLYKER